MDKVESPYYFECEVFFFFSIKSYVLTSNSITLRGQKEKEKRKNWVGVGGGLVPRFSFISFTSIVCFLFLSCVICFVCLLSLVG
jgi:hypothetical protein